MRILLLTFLTAITFFLAPILTFASSAVLSPAVSNLSKEFSEKFCQASVNGMSPEKAGETAAAQISKGLLFSPIMNEIISAPKEDLAASLSNNIFSGCGNNLGGTKEELDDYLLALVKKVPSRSTNSFELAPIRQKASQ